VRIGQRLAHFGVPVDPLHVRPSGQDLREAAVAFDQDRVDQVEGLVLHPSGVQHGPDRLLRLPRGREECLVDEPALVGLALELPGAREVGLLRQDDEELRLGTGPGVLEDPGVDLFGPGLLDLGLRASSDENRSDEHGPRYHREARSQQPSLQTLGFHGSVPSWPWRRRSPAQGFWLDAESP
jgi:hypothetical protein